MIEKPILLLIKKINLKVDFWQKISSKHLEFCDDRGNLQKILEINLFDTHSITTFRSELVSRKKNQMNEKQNSSCFCREIERNSKIISRKN